MKTMTNVDLDNMINLCKGLDSLTINFCPANLKNKSYNQELQDFTIVTKYNLLTENKRVFTTLKSIQYKELAF